MFGGGARSMQDVQKMMAHLSASKLSDEESIASACDVALNDSEPCGDGDQRENLESCGHGEPLYQMWCRGGNLNPWQRPHQYSDFFVACAWGQVHTVEAAVSKVREDRAARLALLERRESNLRYSPLHVAAAGSRLEASTPPWPCKPSRRPEHVGVVHALLRAGARINAKDIMGNTPMGLAAGPFANMCSLEVARAIAKHGPDLLTRTRFGHPLLFQPCACMSPGPNVEAISLLLELGADPTASMGAWAHFEGASSKNSLYLFLQHRGYGQALALLEPLSHHCLPIGTAVEIHGLAARADLNSARAVIRGWHSKENRYAVELTSLMDTGATVHAAGGLASRVKVKPANLRKVVEERDAVEATEDLKGIERGPLHIKAPRVVRMHGLQSRPDLNGRHGVVEKWDQPAGRYHLRVRPTTGHRAEVLRVKPENISKDICEDNIDPDKLPPWRGHGALRSHHGPLATCFESAMPVGALMGLSSGRTEAELAPRVQFLYSLFHIAIAWEKHAQHCWRHVLEHAASGTSVTIDVLRRPLECPEHVEAAATRFKRGTLDGTDKDAAGGPPAAAEPLLLVRYLAATREPSRQPPTLPVALLDATLPGRCSTATACSFAADASGGAQVNLVQAASAAQVSQAVAMLQASTELLDEAFAARFYAQSEHHRAEDGYFRCSFLVPPTEKMLQEPMHRVQPSSCIVCGKSAPDGEKLKRCARCNSAEYCSKECQSSHWKEHKKLCGKSAEQLRARGGGDGSIARASLVFDLAYVPVAMQGMAWANISVSGQTTRPRVLKQGKAPKNIHGSEEFAVKVQASDAALLGSEAAMPCHVYDEARSFTGFLECHTPGITPLLRLIQGHGAHFRGRGAKGYFLARREGTSLRIFTDRILPQPAW
uniref:MYND-type domain-containing protein n=1 Tax=Calcidiscus leptoporus TaxID=127549 RepID=A0A7S0NRM5_9EUKA|mmetsp:Transcript_20211/g.46638  ORF Transcript_20211/g.46638 Transcript_20211/m.46638 type:complete len:885 (+) Transcript_20211:91-2745(+)